MACVLWVVAVSRRTEESPHFQQCVWVRRAYTGFRAWQRATERDEGCGSDGDGNGRTMRKDQAGVGTTVP